MALDKLTIIDGGGLSTTSDYRVGVITATKFVGPVEGSITATDATFSGNVSIAGTLTYEDVTNVDSVGIITARNGIKVSTGTATTALVVDGDARVTGILTVGTGSLTLDGPNNVVNVGTALTLGHTQGLQFHTQNLHSEGFEINQINASGIITATGADINGDLDVDGHTNLDNLSVAGVSTFTGAVTAHDYRSGDGVGNTLYLTSADDWRFRTTGGAERLRINASGNVKLPDSGEIQLGGPLNSGNGDLQISHNGSNTYITNNTGYMVISSESGSTYYDANNHYFRKADSSEYMAKFLQDGAVELYHNNHKSFTTNANGITLTAPEGGDCVIDMNADEGDDNPDKWRLNVSQGGSFQLKNYADGSWENHIQSTVNSSVELFHNGSKKFETKSSGINVLGHVHATSTGSQIASGDTSTNNYLLFYHDGSNGFIQNGSGSLTIKDVSGGNIEIQATSGETSIFCGHNGAVQLYYDGGNKLETTSTGIDTDTIRLAGLRFPRTQPNNGLDFMTIGHGGTSGIGEIDCLTNMMRIKAGEVQLANRFGNVEMLTCNSFGSVEIFHNGSKKFETSSSGATITGTLVSDGLSVGNGEHISLGNSNQFKLYHDGSNAALQTTSGNTYLYGGGGNFLIRPVNAEQGLNVIANGAVELFHNDVKVCTTTTEGIRVQGAEGGGGKVEIYADEGDDNADKWHLLANTDGTLLIRNLSDGSWDTNIKLSSTSTELYADDDRVFFTETRGVRIGDATKIFEDSTHASAVIQNTDIHHSIILRGSSNANGTTITPGNTTTFREYGDFVFRTGPINAQERFIIEAGGTCKFIKGVDGGTDEDIAKFIPDGAVELYHNASKKFETTSTGIVATGNVTANHSNGQIHLQATDGSIEITRTAGGAYIDFKNSTSEDYDIRINEEGGAFRVNTHFRLYDNKALELGNRTGTTYGDLRLYHDTSNNIIEGFTGSLNIRNYDTNSTNINISARNNILLQTNLNETAVQCIANGAVEIFHDSGTYGTAKLVTTTTGIKVNGTGLALNVDGGYIRSVGGQPSVVAHKSSSTFCHIGVENNSNARAFLAYTNDKNFIIGRRTAYTGDNTGYSGRDISIDATNHAVDICYNGSTKFKTTSGGVDITGLLECDGISTNSGYVNLQGTATTKILLQGVDGNQIRYRNAAGTYVANITSIGNGDTFQIQNEKQSQYLNIESGGVRIGGRLTLPTTDTGIRFGPGTALNDSASIEWKGGDNAGYLRISTDDDQDAQTPAEYIEFGDYANQNRVGTFTQHVKISRSEFLVSTGTNTVASAARFKVNQDGNTEILRNLYLTDEFNMTAGGNKNRFIDASMANNEALFIRSTQGGDTGHHNMALFHRNGSVNLYHANNEKIATQAHGINVYGDIHMGGLSNTGTNQNRQIYWTGFDKESSGDNSDFAHIKHTTNIHGITGSVLEIKAENDASDGIALAASNGNGIIAAVCKKFDVSGYIEPSYGSGDQGIKWQPDPAGGSGDIATMQYYADGSGENLRLRILIGNDGDDDLFFEASGQIYAQGTFSAQTKNFRIPHVLTGLTTTTDLVHSSIEGPQADNLYRGRTKLVAGISTVNIDATNNMTDGTFVNLNRDVQCFTSNETGWTAVKGSVTGNLLTIVAQDNTCTDTISWMVVGERWDLAMYNPLNPMTDENGKLRTEVPNRNYAKGYNEDYIRENKFRVGISTISRPSIENKEVE